MRRNTAPAVLEWRAEGELFRRLDQPGDDSPDLMVNVLDDQVAVFADGSDTPEFLEPGLHLRQPAQRSDGGAGADTATATGSRLVFVSLAPSPSLHWGFPAPGEDGSRDAGTAGQWQGRISLQVTDAIRLATRVVADPALPASTGELVRQVLDSCLASADGAGTIAEEDELARRIEARFGDLGLRVARLALTREPSQTHEQPAAAVERGHGRGPDRDTTPRPVQPTPHRPRTGEPASTASIVALAEARADDGSGDDGQARYYIGRDGSQRGPFTLAEVMHQVESGRIDDDTLVWKPGLTDWVGAAQLEELGLAGTDGNSSADSGTPGPY